MIKVFVEGLLDLVYPPNCLICKNFIDPRFSRRVLCAQCLALIEFNHPPFCRKCSRHLDRQNRSGLCETCQDFNPSFDEAYGCCFYNPTLKELIHQFKYGQKMFLKNLFAELMSLFISQYSVQIQSYDLIIPIPLHPTRLRERGYNQAQLLAQELCRTYQIPLCLNALSRAKFTNFQARLSEKERWTNIHGAFKMKPNIGQNKRILIVDDLLTTGATASEAARVLKEAGAEKVGILTLAIA